MTTFSAGQRLTAAQLENILAPGWTDYSGTFTLTGAVTNPTKGNSTYTAHYRRSTGGDLVIVRIRIVIGSTFSAGSGAYSFLLPVNASTGAINGSAGSVYVLDAGTAHRNAVSLAVTATTLQCYRNGDASAFGSTVPQTWATGDEIRIWHAYEPA